MLLELKKELDNRDIELWLSRIHGLVRDALERSEYLQEIGPDKIHRRGLDSIFEYISRKAPHEIEEMELVKDGLNTTLEVVDQLLTFTTGEQYQFLASYRDKLAEISVQLKQKS